MPTPAQQNKKVMVIILAGGGMPSGFLQALARARRPKPAAKNTFSTAWPRPADAKNDILSIRRIENR
jgi:hypothetical protein